MTAEADLVCTNAEVHSLTEPDETYEAVAVRDGEIVRVDSAYEIEFLEGVETDIVDLEGKVLLPGFIDAHTHLETSGKYLVHADLSGVGSAGEAVETLRAEAREDGWMLGFGWDESDWPEGRYLRREDLDRVSEDRPVAAMRVDMHTAALNSVALDRLAEELPEEEVHYEDGRPTGVVVEDAVGVVFEEVGGSPDETREFLEAARDRCQELGITGVHEKVRDSYAPQVYRELEQEGELGMRVRIDYWSDHLDAVLETGLRSNHGSSLVEVGGIKSFTDGSLGGRTAKLTEPYADIDPTEQAGEDDDGLGQWVVDPDEFRELVEQVDREGLQMVTHAIGDVAIDLTVEAYEETEAPGDVRHRIEHVELATDEAIERMADLGVVASCQPNFHQWAQDGGLYDSRLGTERRKWTNRLRTILDAGVPLAFGSDSMPLGPLEGIHHAVNAPTESQRLTVTEALRAYTQGAAYAGHDEGRLGTIEVGKRADFVVLDASPWENEDSIREIDVEMTVVDGEIVYDGE